MRRLPFLLVLAACSSGPPAPAEDPPAAEIDPAYTVYGVHEWLLVGNALTPGQDEMTVQVIPPEGVDVIDYWIDGGPGRRLSEGPDFIATIDVSDLAAGEHELLMAADGADTAFARFAVKRTAPLYVLMTTDWDDADNSDASLQLQEELRAEFPDLVMTHFVGPYTFTDPAITDERRGVMVDWVTGMRDDHGDEIGLHIHPYCNFVDTTSVPCRTEPSTVYAGGDATGYTVMCSAYTREEFATLLAAADDLFEANGLGKPTSFRAGGWTAEINTLQSLADAGYVTDTSALNWQYLEEWMGVQNGVLYTWNMSHWSGIGDTSQPYYPGPDDIQAPADPGADVGVLELPDNGILVDYVTAEEMIAIFDANWDRTPLTEPRALSIGYHPPNFSILYKTRLLDTLHHVQQFRASYHAGPVVYGRQSDMVQVWPR